MKRLCHIMKFIFHSFDCQWIPYYSYSHFNFILTVLVFFIIIIIIFAISVAIFVPFRKEIVAVGTVNKESWNWGLKCTMFFFPLCLAPFFPPLVLFHQCKRFELLSINLKIVPMGSYGRMK